MISLYYRLNFLVFLLFLKIIQGIIMQAVSVQPMPAGQAVSINFVNTNEWSSGICDCCEDMGICKFLLVKLGSLMGYRSGALPVDDIEGTVFEI